MEEEPPVKIEWVSGSKHLYILFGGIGGKIGIPPFEFYNSSNILGESRIFIRDVRQSWYHTGLPGISTRIDETAAYLRDLISGNSPDRMTMVGNSMGGFAAILFSSLIGNARAVAFAPQTFISPFKRLRYWDRRWAEQIARTHQLSPKSCRIWDLATLKSRPDWSADIYVSTKHRLDHQHAKNLSAMDNVRIHKYRIGGHALVKKLRDSGELAGILQGLGSQP